MTVIHITNWVKDQCATIGFLARIIYTKLLNIPTGSRHRSHPFMEIEESKV
jgi:hypothetical protein